MKKRKLNPYEQYVAWLKDGTLLNQPLQIGFRQYVRDNEQIPDNIKNLLCGGSGTGGLIGQCFQLMYEIMGNMEVAYRRGYSAGYEDAKKEKV